MKRATTALVAVGAMLLCVFEAWELWGITGLAVAVPVAVLATIVGLRTFSPR